LEELFLPEFWTLISPRFRWKTIRTRVNSVSQPVVSRFEDPSLNSKGLMSPASLSGLTILVVEDHDDARRYVELFLRTLGANVVGARNAVEGLEMVKTQSPAVVLSDILMPGGDGFHLLREIRALERGREAAVPVIAMTALVSLADGRRILDAGFNAYLRKPFTPDRLLDTIASVLNPDR
jgi:CheY-like chemotaxis protein